MERKSAEIMRQLGGSGKSQGSAELGSEDRKPERQLKSAAAASLEKSIELINVTPTKNQNRASKARKLSQQSPDDSRYRSADRVPKKTHLFSIS